jgi:hypothetical protein
MFLGLFRDSPLLFALQRLNLLNAGPDLSMIRLQRSQAEQAEQVSSSRSGPESFSVSLPGPVDAAQPRPLADAVILSALLPGTVIASMDGPPVSPFEMQPPGLNVIAQGGRFQVHFLNGVDDPMVVDTLRMEILPGRATDPQLGGGDHDTLLLAGPFDGTATLPLGLSGLEDVILQGGTNYDLSALDSHVDAGARLVIDARDLGPGDAVRFDAAGERDGAFLFFGGHGDDTFIGGAGADRMFGGAGADTLRGGGGADTFGYQAASESSSLDYDSLLDFNPSEDRIDLPATVSGFSAAVTSGSLSAATFDADLTAVFAGLGAGSAGVFAPTAGDLAGTLFLVVDGNGQAGYQPGEDFVFALPGTAPADLGASTAIFI